MTPATTSTTTSPREASIAIERSGRQITLRVLHEDGVQDLGSFANAADAWRALDRIDAPALG